VVCGFTSGKPVISPKAIRLSLLHGVLELAYFWREMTPSIAAAGYRVVAPYRRAAVAPRVAMTVTAKVSRRSVCVERDYGNTP